MHRSPQASRRASAAAPAAEEAASAPASSDEEDDLRLDGQDEDADAQREILAALRSEGDGEELVHAAAAQRIAERVAAERPRRSQGAQLGWPGGRGAGLNGHKGGLRGA